MRFDILRNGDKPDIKCELTTEVHVRYLLAALEVFGYEQKRLVAINLKDCIRDRGYTKISIANKLGLDKSELENILV